MFWFKCDQGTEEISQWLRALAPAEDQVRFPAPMKWHTTDCNFSFKRSGTLAWLPWGPGMYTVHRHTCKQNTHRHET